VTRRVCLVVVAMLALGACHSASGVVIEEDADGTTISLGVGEAFDVALPANPSTGFIWEPVEFDETILRWTGVRDFDPESTAIGAPGTMHLTFETIAAGTTTLELVYHRTFETVEPADTFTVTITVG